VSNGGAKDVKTLKTELVIAVSGSGSCNVKAVLWGQLGQDVLIGDG
jgi:hypothetical protein